MAVQTGSSAGWLDLLDDLVTFATANGWVLEKTATISAGLIEERYLRGPGSVGTAPVYVNIRTGATPASGIYHWKVYGAIGFDESLAIYGQPGSSQEVNLLLWQNNIDYWFYINDRRIIVVAKVNTSYFSMYAGFFLPFANPIEYPYPLLIAASMDNAPVIYTTLDSGIRSMADPGENGAFVRDPMGSWVELSNHGDDFDTDDYEYHFGFGYYVWPYSHSAGGWSNGEYLNWWDIRPPPNEPSANIIIPLHLFGADALAGIVGIYDDVYYIPGFNIGAEQSFSINLSRAVGTLTASANPSNGETVVIGGKTYTFQTTLTNVDGNVKIGATLAESLQNLQKAINLGVGAATNYALATTLHPTVSAENETATTLTVKAKEPGTGGNAIATTETLANGSWGGATLNGGGAAQTFRIFPNINRNGKNHFFCVKEV